MPNLILNHTYTSVYYLLITDHCVLITARCVLLFYYLCPPKIPISML